MAKFTPQGGVSANYVLGRGKLYLRGELGKYDGSTFGVDSERWRDIGNVTAFTISYERETKDHTSYLTGLQTIDLSLAISTKMNVGFSCDELSVQNMAMFFGAYILGADNGATVFNPAKAASNNALFTGNENMYFACPLLGATGEIFFDTWIDIELTRTSNSTVYHAYDFESQANQAISVRVGDNTRTSADGTPLVEGTDYELDRKAGMIKFLDSGAISEGDDITVAWAAGTSGLAALDTELYVLSLLESSGNTVELKFVQENPNDSDTVTVVHLLAVKLQPDGDYAGIGDDWAALSFAGVAQAATENIPAGSSPYGYIVQRNAYAT